MNTFSNQSTALEHYKYERSPANIFRAETFSLRYAVQGSSGHGGTFLLFKDSSDAQRPQGGKPDMAFARKKVRATMHSLAAIGLGLLIFSKLLILVIWHSVRYPTRESIIDYERGTVRLKSFR